MKMASKGKENVSVERPPPFSSDLSLEGIRQIQSKFAAERNWIKYHTPRNLLLAMIGEVGELSELFQWRGEVSPGLPGWSQGERDHLGQELSDVLIYLKFEMNAVKYPPSEEGRTRLKHSKQEVKGEE